MADLKISQATPTTPIATDIFPIARVGSGTAFSVTLNDILSYASLAETTGATGTGNIVFEQSATLVTPTIESATVSGGTFTSPTLVTPTVTSPTVTNPTVSGGTFTSATLVTPTIESATVSGGTFTSATLVTPTIESATVSGGTFTSATLVTPTIESATVSGGTFTSATLVTPTIESASFDDAAGTALYLGFSGDQGGGQPLQVNGGALFNGPISFPPTFGIDIPALSFKSTVTGPNIGNPGADVGYLDIFPILNATGIGTNTTNIVAARLSTGVGASNTQAWNNIGAAYVTFSTVGGSTGAIATGAALSAAVIHTGAQTITNAYAIQAAFDLSTGPITNATAGRFWANPSSGGTNLIDMLLGTATPPASGSYAIYSATTRPSVFSGPMVATSYASSPPVTITGSTYTMQATDSDLILTGTNCVVTFLAASACTGREVNVLTRTANSMTSASSNICPLTSGTPGTAVLAATGGKWARLKSDGTNWLTMSAN